MAQSYNPNGGRPKGKKGPTKGSGGQGKRALRGKGPTPKAEDRVYHAAHQRKLKREVEAAKEAQRQAHRTRSAIKIQPEHELVVGRNSVYEAISAGISITRVFLAANPSDERIAATLRTATALGAPVFEVTKRDLENASGETTHQGIGIEVPAYQYCSALELLDHAEAAHTPALIVALDQITDPHNLGAVLRSAGAFGATGVLITSRRSAHVNATVWKVSAGAAARVPVAEESNLVTALKALKKAGCFILGLDGGGEVNVRSIELANQPLVLVTGAEGQGLSRLVRQACDQIVSIPIASAVESLNAAVATGIALHEVAAQRREKGGAQL